MIRYYDYYSSTIIIIVVIFLVILYLNLFLKCLNYLLYFIVSILIYDYLITIDNFVYYYTQMRINYFYYN